MKRSQFPCLHHVRINGRDTSITVEPEFWEQFRLMTMERQTTIGKLLAEIDRTGRLLPHQGPGRHRVRTLSAALRVFVLQTLISRSSSGARAAACDRLDRRGRCPEECIQAGRSGSCPHPEPAARSSSRWRSARHTPRANEPGRRAAAIRSRPANECEPGHGQGQYHRGHYRCRAGAVGKAVSIVAADGAASDQIGLSN